MHASGSDLKNAYDILGVAPNADPVTIRRAWMALVRSYDPKAPGQKRADVLRKLALIDAAFDVVDTNAAIEQLYEAKTRKADPQPMRAQQSHSRKSGARRARQHPTPNAEPKRQRAFVYCPEPDLTARLDIYL